MDCSVFVKVLLVLGVAAFSGASALGGGRDDRGDPALQTYFAANGLLKRGLYELAVAEYRTFLSDQGNHEKAPMARYGMGVSLFRMGRHEDAVDALSLLRGNNSFEYAAEVGMILGQSHLARRRYAEAVQSFKEVVRKRGGHDLADDAAAGCVEALYLDEKREEAIEACHAFVTHWPESPLRERAEFFSGLAAMGLHDHADAAERFKALLDRYPEGTFAKQASLLLAQCYQHGNGVNNAIRQYRKILKQTGSRYIPDALLGLATLLQQQGKPADAGSLLEQLLERYQKSPLLTTARFQRGRAWFDQERYDRAFTMFEQVAGEGDELSEESAYWMAKCKLREGDFDGAATRFADAISRFPETGLLPEMLYDRAIALIRGGRHDEAVMVLETFGSRYPEHALAADALQLLAATEHQRHRFDQSQEHCQVFLEQYPSHHLAAAVAFLSGENGFLGGDYEAAIDRYRRFLTGYSDDPQAGKARFRLGAALYRLERLEEAEQLLTEVTDGAETEDIFRPALLTLGDIHFQRSEWKQAERHLGHYLSFGPDMPSADDALLKLGLSRQRQGKNKGALGAYDELIARFNGSPHRLQTLFERGQALVAVGRNEEAVSAFEAVLREGDNSRFAPFALNHLAAIALQRKDFDDAATLYERVAVTAQETSVGADALFANAHALMAAQRFKAAQEAFTRFLNRYPSHPRSTQARAQRAIALARQDRHAEALEAINEMERARASDPHGPGIPVPSLQAAVQYEKAWCLRELGRPEEAAQVYRGLIDKDKTGGLDVHALLELSGIEFGANRFEDAAKPLRRLRTIMASEAVSVPIAVREQTTYRLGVCEFELDRFDEAARLLEEFIEAFPDSSLMASASFYCGEALFRLGRHDRAAKHLSRVVEEYDDDQVWGPSLLRLGECLSASQRWARSERAFAEYLDRFPDSGQGFQAQFGIGWARENQQRHDEAIIAYRKVIGRHQGPTAARAQFQIGECLFAKRRYDEAVRELLKVDILYAYPEWSAAALYEAGRCFEKLSKPVEARAHFKQVVERHKQTRWAELASQQLSEPSSAALPGR